MIVVCLVLFDFGVVTLATVLFVWGVEVASGLAGELTTDEDVVLVVVMVVEVGLSENRAKEEQGESKNKLYSSEGDFFFNKCDLLHKNSK